MTNQITGRSLKILIIGSYGIFDGRLVHLLSDLPQLTLVICGRSSTKAEAFCADYGGAAKAVSLVLEMCDSSLNISAALTTALLFPPRLPFRR